MKKLIQAAQTTVGMKFLVAVTGALLFLFVVGHMLGNLQIFLGPEALNSYAAKLKSLGPLLWVMRLGLLAVFVAHIGLTVRLTMLNREARPVDYRDRQPIASTMPSRTMILSGGLVLAFVVYHLLHFTVGVTHPEHFARTDAEGMHDVYAMVILGFREPAVALSYIVAQVLLAMHLSHGVGSLFQTLGLNTPNWVPVTKAIGIGSAVVILIGNLAIVLAVFLGYLKLPGELL